MYSDIFSIGPVTVHGYGLLISIGIIMAYALTTVRAKHAKIDDSIIVSLLFWIVVGGFLGAKLFYIFVQLKEGITDFKILFDMRNGLVVYGGVIGGLIAIYIFCRIKRFELIFYLDLIAPAVALAQGFGRIGCFLAGCCYGMESNSPISVIFPENSAAPSGIKLFPIQLFFSGFDFALFFILIMVDRNNRYKGKVSSLYLVIYSLGRFVLEFFRGDIERGNIGILSTSQFISIFIFISGIIFLLQSLKHKKSYNVN
jgi:phosphatidylglycerol:prolipoprotein diacylglycerol transferase